MATKTNEQSYLHYGWTAKIYGNKKGQNLDSPVLVLLQISSFPLVGSEYFVSMS